MPSSAATSSGRPSSSRVAESRGASEAALRTIRYESTERLGLRATGHTASDQVETVLYRLVSSGNARGIKPKREDGVVRPLCSTSGGRTPSATATSAGSSIRIDSSNADTKRGLIRDEILPLLRRLHPGADRNLLALADERTAPSARARADAARAARVRRRDEGAPTWAAASARCASTTRCGSRGA